MKQLPKNRLFRMLLRLVRSERGGGEVLTTTIMAAIGILGASMSIKPFLESSDMANDAMKHQAGVLSRGADTGMRGDSPGGGSGSNGFDIGGALEKVGGVASKLGEAASAAASKAQTASQKADQGQQGNGIGQANGTGQGNGTGGTASAARGHR